MFITTIRRSIYIAIVLNCLNIDYCHATESYPQPQGDYFLGNPSSGRLNNGAYTQFSNHQGSYHPYYRGTLQGVFYPYYQGDRSGFATSYQSHSCFDPDYRDDGNLDYYDDNPGDPISYQYPRDCGFEDDACLENEAPKSSKVNKPKLKRSKSIKWTPEEDKTLDMRVRYHLLHNGKVAWSGIQKKFFPTRTSKSLRERWMEHLKPGLDKSPLNHYEKDFVYDFVLTHGKRWTEIAKRLPGRSPNRLKNYWNSAKRKKMREAIGEW